MYWELCKTERFTLGRKSFVKIFGNDVVTNTLYWVYISDETYKSLKNGVNFNTALKDYDFATKKFLATGVGSRNSSLFSFKRTINRKVFITNAVANSVAYYAWVYINHHYKAKDSSWLDYNIEDIQNKFINQSKEFLLLYKDIVDNIDKILPKFSEEELEHYFKCKELGKIKKYMRKVYHTKLECEYMRSDYSDTSTHHANTGIFHESPFLEGTHTYCLDESYLKELGMRECKVCQSESFDFL